MSKGDGRAEAYYLLQGGGSPSPSPGPPANPRHLQLAFCIPTDPFRVWWPAYLGQSRQEQERYIQETKERGYTAGEVLVSGWPYRNDYPYIAPNAGVLRAGLEKMKLAGLTTIVAFDDSRGADLGYLRDVVIPNRDVIDWCMGIYEVNGVLKDPELVLSTLRQCRGLLPDAYLAVHFTPQDPGEESYGLVNWQQAKDQANLQCFFFQTAGWRVGINDAIARMQDFTRRLGGPGFHGYPTLELGVVDFENTTSLTYRWQMSESDAVAFTDAMVTAPLYEDDGVAAVPPTGFGDGGTPKASLGATA